MLISIDVKFIFDSACLSEIKVVQFSKYSPNRDVIRQVLLLLFLLCF